MIFSEGIMNVFALFNFLGKFSALLINEVYMSQDILIFLKKQLTVRPVMLTSYYPFRIL